jgi:hypothetical protein
MALRLPIVAYGTTAVPHTLGDAGLLWNESDPFLLAQSIDTVVRDAVVRRTLIERGWQRYQQHFANHRIEREFLDALFGDPTTKDASRGLRFARNVNASANRR